MAAAPARADVDPADCWDLTQLYATDTDWLAAVELVQGRLPELEAFRGRLHDGAQTVRDYLDTMTAVRLEALRVSQYARRLSDQDKGNDDGQAKAQRAAGLIDRMEQVTAFFQPEINRLDDALLNSYLAAPELEPFRFVLEKVVRQKAHTLSDEQEKLLAMAGDVLRGPYLVFNQLNAVDLKFESIQDEKGEPLAVSASHALYMRCMTSPDRRVRKDFFNSYYGGYASHRNTFGASLGTAIKSDVFLARARGFDGCRQAALFTNNIPEAVYDNLVTSVHNNLEPLYDYFDLVSEVLGIDELHVYDTLAPLVPEVDLGRSYDDAVELLYNAFEPLGDTYRDTLREGLLHGWVDRYENQGKYTGAYSSSVWGTHPYVLMNYRPGLDSIYTLAHEAGHAMHSWMSHKAQPPQISRYSIFAAEVASTFNEALLTHYLLANTDDPRMRAYIIAHQVDSIRGLIYRQTMFAEFEHLTHGQAEADEPVTIGSLSTLYRELLDTYFGPNVVIDDVLENECLRIPHFYFSFYVYQYATGVAAALALSERVLAGEEGALERYHGFLSAGGSRWPIDALREAGVDMTQPGPVDDALALFSRRVTELRGLLLK